MSERNEESSIEGKYKQEYLIKLEEAISEGTMKKSLHPINMKYKDPNLEAKVCGFVRWNELCSCYRWPANNCIGFQDTEFFQSEPFKCSLCCLDLTSDPTFPA